MKTVSCFSAGVSSAVATKLIIDEIDEIHYIHIEDQHPDSMRFVVDCEKWFGKKVEILQSEKYDSVEDCCLKTGFLVGPMGASCTSRLKVHVRKEWEKKQEGEICYVWGFDCSEREKQRFLNRCDNMPEYSHRAPLIESSISKEHAHQILAASGIKRPYMYDLGYPNNNCLGCVKGGAGYWNKIRADFPEVFKRRARMEKKMGNSCMNGKYLDELNPEEGRNHQIILDDCGLLCELMAI